MPRYSSLSTAPRRRKSPLPAILITLLVLLIGGAIYLTTVDTEVPQQRIEQDVTNEALAK
jgi:hypothetical protein